MATFQKNIFNGLFGRHYGEKLYNLLNDCCSEAPGGFCSEVKSCLKVSPEGNPSLVLNQQGEWITNGSGSDQNLQQVTDVGNTTTNSIILDESSLVFNNNSFLSKGTNEFGGAGGISQFCSIGYEQNWQAGINYVLDNSNLIRTATNCFNTVPNNTFDDTQRFKVGSRWILDNGYTYVCTDASTGAAVWIPQSSPGYTYEIGQYVAAQGGVIAHRWLSTSSLGSPTSGTIQNYLVVDTADLSTFAQWASLNVDISNVESTWDGFTNTANLIAAGAGSGIAVGTAAELCNSSTNNGKSDWHLPALDELIKIFQNRWDIAQGITTASGTTLSLTTYWSSTEFAIANAWGFNLSGGNATNSNKASTYYVRAVRKFSI